jgi:hypothetical protein
MKTQRFPIKPTIDVILDWSTHDLKTNTVKVKYLIP